MPRSLGHSQLTSLSSAVGLGTPPDGATQVWIQAKTKDVNWRDDGTDPTTTVGHTIYAGQTLEYTGNRDDFAAVKLIEAEASAKVNLVWW